MELVYTRDLKSRARLGLRVRVPHQLPFSRTNKEGDMRKIAHWALALTIFYFWVNGLADNPDEVEAFRQQMNAIVDKGISAIKGATL